MHTCCHCLFIQILYPYFLFYSSYFIMSFFAAFYHWKPNFPTGTQSFSYWTVFGHNDADEDGFMTLISCFVIAWLISLCRWTACICTAVGSQFIHIYFKKKKKTNHEARAHLARTRLRHSLLVWEELQYKDNLRKKSFEQYWLKTFTYCLTCWVIKSNHTSPLAWDSLKVNGTATFAQWNKSSCDSSGVEC